jgi:hypothetical protein
MRVFRLLFAFILFAFGITAIAYSQTTAQLTYALTVKATTIPANGDLNFQLSITNLGTSAVQIVTSQIFTVTDATGNVTGFPEGWNAGNGSELRRIPGRRLFDKILRHA